MNLIKNQNVPDSSKKLSLDVFKEKMMDGVHQEKGAGSSYICGYVAGYIAGAVYDALDSCHD